MARTEQIKSAYKLTGSNAGFYDGMMTYSTLPGKAICRLVWRMDGEKNLRARKRPIKIITGHTGWTDDLDFAFQHRAEVCKPFTKKYTDPSAPYDGYIEDDDTEESARNVLLRKVAVQ